MVYRRTEKVARHLAQRHAAIMAAARDLASESGMGALHVTAVAARAGIAAGTMYRYFPSKADLVAALITAVSEEEMSAIARATQRAPGSLSALTAAVATFAARAFRRRRLAWAVLGEPVEPEADQIRQVYRIALRAEFESRLETAIRDGHLPDQDTRIASVAALGALLEGLLGSELPELDARPGEAARALTVFVLRGLGLRDAHAWGLAAQYAAPLQS
jgi:AcrR family transcriptional regulator